MARDTDFTTSVTEQAAHWWVMLHEDSSPADRREFGEWVARSPERVEAYLRIVRVHQALKSRSLRWPATQSAVLIREAKAAAADAVQQLPRRNSTFATEIRPGRTKLRMSLALGLAAALVIGIGSAWLSSDRPQHFQTKFGEQRSILLDDGSHVTLNTASKIEIRLQKHRRLVHLVEGEALFEVAHDPARPFDVRAGNAMLRAVGTRFDVDVRPSRTTVTVVEGRVAIVSETGRAGQGTELPTLAAADRLVITRSGPGVPQHGTSVAAAIAWTQRQLVFEHRPLGEVAEEFNRYNRGRIEIGTAVLRAQEVTGVFRSDDPASFVSFLSSIPGVRIRDDGSGGHIVTADVSAPSGE
jgi:transmembrane sensor